MNDTVRKPITVEIDDSGTGDIVGDAFIGLYVKENGKIIFRGVPVGLYNEENHKERVWRTHIKDMVKDGLKQLGFNKEIDKVQICRGNCFDETREWFDKVGIQHEPAIVEGKLQDRVEGHYVKHLRNIGVTSPKLSKESGARRFFILFEWVCRNFPERERYVKVGFPSWHAKWRKKAIRKYKRKYKPRRRNKRQRRNKQRGMPTRSCITKRAEEILNEYM